MQTANRTTATGLGRRLPIVIVASFTLCLLNASCVKTGKTHPVYRIEAIGGDQVRFMAPGDCVETAGVFFSESYASNYLGTIFGE